MDSILQQRLNILKKLRSELKSKNINNPELLLEISFQEQIIKGNIELKDLEKQKKKYKNSKEFKKLIDEMDEIEVTTIKENEYCPITQSKIVNKFVGVCGHAMERSAAETLLKRARPICPKIGCNKILKEKK